MELPLTGPTRVPAAMVVLEQARAAEGMAELLAEALRLKKDTLTPSHMELSLTRPIGLSVAPVGLEQARQ